VIPASDIDKLLLSFCDVRWLKVARIIGKAIQTFESRGVRALEAKGDIPNWRHSEVRLPSTLE
jgi:hypothetical protein